MARHLRRAGIALAIAGALGLPYHASADHFYLICRWQRTWPMAFGEIELRAHQPIYYGDGTMMFSVDFPLAEQDSCSTWDTEVL